jgi:hypothetical protein
MITSTAERPVVVLYTAQKLPLLRDWLYRQRAFPKRFLHVPVWLGVQGNGVPTAPDDDIFERLPEDAVDLTHHPHFWAMIADVHAVMLHRSKLRAALFGPHERGVMCSGYHVNASYAAVRAYFADHAQVLDAEDLVREQSAAPRPSEDETLKRVASLVPIGPRSRTWRSEAHDYLLGGGARPSDPRCALRALRELFTGLSPRAFNEVHLRALDLLALDRKELFALEPLLTLHDPAFDLHYLWRDMLRSRGVAEGVIEASAVRAWVEGDSVTTRGWWLLAQAHEDIETFLDIFEGVVDVDTLHGRLLDGAWETWELPRVRALTEDLVARCGERLSVGTLTRMLEGARGPAFSALLAKHFATVFEGRSRNDVQQLRKAMEAADSAPADEGAEDDD